MKISYAHRMIRNLNKLPFLKMNEYDENDLPKDIVEIINTHKDFVKSKVFGKKNLGEPQEYEKLIIIDKSGTREFEYYNKGIFYLTMGTEKDRPVFQVFSELMSKDEE
jgi:hypothetical protein